MNLIDIIILACLGIALVHGLSKGFITQAVSLVSLVLGVWLSFTFSSAVSLWLEPYLDVPGTVLQVISFAIILVAVILCLNLVGRALTGLVKLVMLGWLDKLLGIAFALLKAVLIIGLAFSLFDILNARFELIAPEKLGSSVFYKLVKDLADLMFPYLKQMIFNK